MKTIIVNDFCDIPKNFTGIVKFPTKSKCWFKNGLLHREDGPAQIYTNYMQRWFKNDKLHRENGPAVEYSNGNKRYYLNDKWIKNENLYWFLILTFIKNNKKIPEMYFKRCILKDDIKMKKIKFCFDIDNTLCITKKGNFAESKPILERIQYVNNLYDQGHYIYLQTARGMDTEEQDQQQAYENYYEFTINQLNTWGLKYHKLFMGKVAANIFIDDKGMSDMDFFDKFKK